MCECKILLCNCLGEALHLVTADQHNGVDIEASDVRGEHSVKTLSVSPESLLLRALPPGSETELNTEIDQCSYPSPLLGNDPVAHKQQRLQVISREIYPITAHVAYCFTGFHS